MAEWQSSALGTLVEVKGGKRLPKGVSLLDKPNSHPYIRIRDLGKSKTLELTTEYGYVDDTTQTGLARYIVNEGDVLLSIVGTIGLTAIVGASLNKANLTENCVRFVNLNGIDAEFLYYYLTSSLGQNEIRKGTVGAVQPKLPIKNIQSFIIRYPSLDYQKQIVSLLKAIDDKIEYNVAINNNLQQQMGLLFKAWFIDNPDSKEWTEGVFADFVDGVHSGDWGKETANSSFSQQVYCIRGADIPSIKSGNRGKMPTRYIRPKNLLSKKLCNGDIVVEISGGSPTQSTGRATPIVQSLIDRYDEDLVCTNFCKALTPKKQTSLFVYSYWQYLYDKGVFFNYENGTTGIKNLDITGILETEHILIPPTSMIEHFNSLCCTCWDKITANGLESERLSILRDSLLSKLMSGEIDVSDVEI